MHCQHHNKAIILAKILQLDALPNANQQSENIGNSGFYCDTSTSLKPTKDDPQGSGWFVNQSLLILCEQLKHNSRASPTRNKLVLLHQMLAMHTSVFCYYQDQHVKPDRRSLSRRGYQVSQTVWSISRSKGYSIPLLTQVIPAPFGISVHLLLNMVKDI